MAGKVNVQICCYNSSLSGWSFRPENLSVFPSTCPNTCHDTVLQLGVPCLDVYSDPVQFTLLGHVMTSRLILGLRFSELPPHTRGQSGLRFILFFKPILFLTIVILACLSHNKIFAPTGDFCISAVREGQRSVETNSDRHMTSFCQVWVSEWIHTRRNYVACTWSG